MHVPYGVGHDDLCGQEGDVCAQLVLFFTAEEGAGGELTALDGQVVVIPRDDGGQLVGSAMGHHRDVQGAGLHHALHGEEQVQAVR